MKHDSEFQNTGVELPCPHCGMALRRTNRSAWMRLLAGSKKFRCSNCSRRYMLFLGKFFGVRRESSTSLFFR